MSYNTTNALRPSGAPTSKPSTSYTPSLDPSPLPSALPTGLPSSTPTSPPSSQPSILPTNTIQPSLTYSPTSIHTAAPTSSREGLCLIGEDSLASYTSCGAVLLNVSSRDRNLIGFEGYDSLYKLQVMSPRTVRAVVCPHAVANASVTPYLWLYEACPFNGSIPLLSTSDETSQSVVRIFL